MLKTHITSDDGERIIKTNFFLPYFIFLPALFYCILFHTLISFFILFLSSLICFNLLKIFKYEMSKRLNDMVCSSFVNGYFSDKNYNSFHHFKNSLVKVIENSEEIFGIKCGHINGFDYIYKNTQDFFLAEYFIFKNNEYLIFINQKPNSRCIRSICKIPLSEITSNKVISFNYEDIDKYYISEKDFYSFVFNIEKLENTGIKEMIYVNIETLDFTDK